MNSPQQVTIKPQLALQSYLDGLLQEATEELQPLPLAVAERVAVAPAPVVVTAPEAIDEFQAAVLEEQARDARLKTAAPAFAEAELVIECRKIYRDALEPKGFLDPQIESNYPQKDYHSVYFGEIVAIRGEAKYRVE